MEVQTQNIKEATLDGSKVQVQDLKERMSQPVADKKIVRVGENSNEFRTLDRMQG